MQPIISIVTSYYQGEKYLAGYLDNLTKQSIFEQIEIILILNEPNEMELRVLDEFNKKYNKLIIINNPKVEKLSKSWNKGCRIANGELISLWNIDDIRNETSLESQIQSLESNPDCVLSYGDYIVVKKYGDNYGQMRKTIKFNKNKFKNGYLTGGGFLVFRKEIFEKIGYFDEQLLCAVDYDFEQRIIHSNLRMIKTEGILGTFTDEGLGISTRNRDDLSENEQIFIRYRYGIFDRVKWEKLSTIKNYDTKNFMFNEQKIPIERHMPRYKFLLFSRQYRKILGVFWNVFRITFIKLGWLEIYRKFRDKIFPENRSFLWK